MALGTCWSGYHTQCVCTIYESCVTHSPSSSVCVSYRLICERFLLDFDPFFERYAKGAARNNCQKVSHDAQLKCKTFRKVYRAQNHEKPWKNIILDFSEFFLYFEKKVSKKYFYLYRSEICSGIQKSYL